MIRSDDNGQRSTGNRPFGRIGELTRYDLVLAIIPIAFLVSVLVGHLLSVPTRTALIAASVVGTLAMIDALFFNPPIRPKGL